MIHIDQPSAYTYQFYNTTRQAWEAMLVALESASQSIYWEIFIFADDDIGKRFIKLLCEKARAGVEVKMILDAMGSINLSRAAEKELGQAGVKMLKFNRLFPEIKIRRWINRLLYRNHRKVLIIDEATVFLGGVNVRDRFQSWDDIYLKLTGKVAWPLMRGFAKSYISCGGNKQEVRHLLHPKLRHGWQSWKQKLQFVVHSPHYSNTSRTHQLFLRAMNTAKETVNLLTPYYVPDKKFLQALLLARQRNVEVNIFLPLRPDHKIMQLLARAYYQLTVNAGAKLYFLPTMNHGKAMSIDKTSGFVGSINVTRRSFRFDEESGVYFSDEKMVHELNEIFNEWKKTAHPFTQELWNKRGWWGKLREWWAKRLENYV